VGAARGFLREAIAFVSWVIALLLAWHFSETQLQLGRRVQDLIELDSA